MAVIRKKPNGKYELDFYPPDGGTRKRRTFETKAEAERVRMVLLGLCDSASSGDGPLLKPKLLKDGIKFYFENVSKSKACCDEEGRYFDRLYEFLRTEGVVMVHDVTTMLMDAFKAKRASSIYRTGKDVRLGRPGKPISSSTVNREFNCYRHFFEKCIDWHMIAKNPCERVENLPVRKNPRRPWTDREFQSIVAHVPQWVGDVLTAMYWLGAGPAELSRVTWGDVDFKRMTVILKRYKGNGDEFRRVMPMPEALTKFMRMKLAQASRMSRAGRTDFVFLNSRRNPIDARPLSTEVRRATVSLHLPSGLVPYGLRHKFGTELLESNVGEDSVRRLMGHRSVKTLIENYSHVRQHALESAMEVRAQHARSVEELNETTAKGDLVASGR